jgi:hypothetical protein
MKPLGDTLFYMSDNPSAYLLAEGSFMRFVELEYNSIASDYYAEVELATPDDKHDVKLAYDRYCALYRAFESSMKRDEGKTGLPNQFKIAAALCFSLRRARPVSSVEPSFSFARRQLEGKLAGLHEVEGTGLEKITPEFSFFYPLADEICAFEIGLRVAKHLTVQTAIARYKELGVDSSKVFSGLTDHYQPAIARKDYINIFVTLRDHATSPYSLLVLYAALFSKPFPGAA